MRRRAFTVLEVIIVCAIMAGFASMLWFVLRNVSGLWRKSDAKEDAITELSKARNSITRDLCNASGTHQAYAKVGPHLGTGYDGDAITFLSSDSGQVESQWALSVQGQAILTSQITYYLVSSDPPGQVAPGPPDAQGFEQQNPYKWLIRRVDPGGAVLAPNWTNWLTRPTSATSLGPQAKVVSNRLLSFRVIQPGPLWVLELSAVALRDARSSAALGNIPLSDSRFTLVDRFSLRSHN